MEKKIKYESDKFSYKCFSNCKHLGGVKVGSTYCINYCKHFIHYDTKPQTVTCNHPNNKPDKEDGSNEHVI